MYYYYVHTRGAGVFDVLSQLTGPRRFPFISKNRQLLREARLHAVGKNGVAII